MAGRFCKTLIPDIARYDPNEYDSWPPDDPAVFGPLVTRELAGQIEEARDRGNRIEKATGEKSPLGDGVPWKGVQDAAGTCEVGSVSGTAERPEVTIRYKYADAPEMGWTDILVLSRSAQGWRVDNIRYGERDGDLRSILAETIAGETP
ncbi:hypothetical protein HW532_00040 [Kaustia mangrovi]|uniref:DUF3828 domain-containing protein n=1 Tax=Kaustia mangrovi TaxID=2593653 RepID=A0A7S8C0U5_9HYPH|nr:hypothetical protein [Kaustia mangrovi]QPC41271.1 hypothetical protein HW532_00040 [Kaustia mangrovi]